MTATSHSPRGMVCAADHLAASAGTAILRTGGSAADAAIAANAVMVVTSPHQCGLGGDLFALVYNGSGDVTALNASGRAGCGADPEALRAEGCSQMPLRDDLRTVTVPGCVDGWLALHRRHGRLPLSRVLADAIGYAENGFGAAPLLVQAAPRVAKVAGADDLAAATAPGARVRRPGVARTLRAIADEGRHGFYQGEFGQGLVRLGGGQFSTADLSRLQADWVEPLSCNAFGHDIWTMPPNSQGYVLLLALAIAERLDLPDDPTDPQWAHLLIEAARQAGRDRPEVLHESADVKELLGHNEIARRANAVNPARSLDCPDLTAGGGTTYLCAVDSDGMAVSLIQSNASGFGSHLFEPVTGIGLHNRGLGFSLRPGHPAEYRPGRRPPHTLAPTVVTRPDGTLRAVAGTMGGDSQPQIMSQVLVRLLHHGQDPTEAIAAPRWEITGSTGFDTWSPTNSGVIGLEAAAPSSWDRLVDRGHRLHRNDKTIGHAHLIEVDTDGMRHGAADFRSLVGAASGY